MTIPWKRIQIALVAMIIALTMAIIILYADIPLPYSQIFFYVLAVFATLLGTAAFLYKGEEKTVVKREVLLAKNIDNRIEKEVRRPFDVQCPCCGLHIIHLPPISEWKRALPSFLYQHECPRKQGSFATIKFEEGHLDVRCKKKRTRVKSKTFTVT